jgi:hypothetical protein
MHLFGVFLVLCDCFLKSSAETKYGNTAVLIANQKLRIKARQVIQKPRWPVKEINGGLVN